MTLKSFVINFQTFGLQNCDIVIWKYCRNGESQKFEGFGSFFTKERLCIVFASCLQLVLWLRRFREGKSQGGRAWRAPAQDHLPRADDQWEASVERLSRHSRHFRRLLLPFLLVWKWFRYVPLSHVRENNVTASKHIFQSSWVNDTPLLDCYIVSGILCELYDLELRFSSLHYFIYFQRTIFVFLFILLRFGLIFCFCCILLLVCVQFILKYVLLLIWVGPNYKCIVTLGNRPSIMLSCN